MTAVDEFKEKYFKENNDYFPIMKKDAKKFMKNYNKEDTLFISSWPSYETTFAIDILASMKINENHKMLYIGEDFGGCTADKSFFYFINNNAKSDEKANISLNDNFVSAYGIHDSNMILEKSIDFTLNEVQEVKKKIEDIESYDSFYHNGDIDEVLKEAKKII